MKSFLPLSDKSLIIETPPVKQKKLRKNNGWWPFLLEIILYYFFWAIFSFLWPTGFIWSNVFAFILTVIAINLFRLFKSRYLETAVVLLLFIFVAMVVVGFIERLSTDDSTAVTASANIQEHGPETIYLPGKKYGRRMSRITFPEGQNFRVTVSGAPVMFFGYYPKERYKMTQKHGTYAYISTRCDHLDFRSLTNRSSVVTIDW
ncbi:MAG TPA: hypothetical protein PLK68_01765 [Thomasclavelia ramosa]|nr:hypothetical protein [Thomasclavelia ramosa]